MGGVSLSVEVEDPTVGGAAQGLAPVRPRLQGDRAGPPELSFLNTKEDFRDLWHSPLNSLESQHCIHFPSVV